jgi:hypothetical protein
MTAAEQRIEIPISKTKIVLMLIGALAFVALGSWFVLSPTTFKSTQWINPAFITIVGYVSILFFGLCAIFCIRKLTGNQPGLIIDEKGLIDNSSGLSAGHILWSDIEDVSVIEIHKQKLIMIHVKNPHDYIVRHNNLVKRKGLELNNKMYGTPLSISSNGLQTSFDNLLAILKDKWQAAKN